MKSVLSHPGLIRPQGALRIYQAFSMGQSCQMDPRASKKYIWLVNYQREVLRDRTASNRATPSLGEFWGPPREGVGSNMKRKQKATGPGERRGCPGTGGAWVRGSSAGVGWGLRGRGWSLVRGVSGCSEMDIRGAGQETHSRAARRLLGSNPVPSACLGLSVP